MKLLQLNTWQGRLIRQIVDFIKEEQPDILCLQEVFSLSDPHTPFTMHRTLELIREASGHHYTFFSPILRSSVGAEQLEYGIAIVSRYPFRHTETVFTNKGLVSKLADIPDRAYNLQLSRIELPGGKMLSLANHHGYVISDPRGNEISTAKMQLVADHLRRIPQPLIFAGDLNVISDSPAMRPLQAMLRDLTAEAGLATTLDQFSHAHRDVACDHIMVGREVHVDRFWAPEVLISDHLPLMLEFSI